MDDFKATWKKLSPAEPERAGALVGEALAVGAQLRSEVVGRRAGDFLRAAGPWRDAAEVAEVAESVRGRQDWDRQDWEQFRRLDRLSDHWWWRPGWRPDRHYLIWYVVFDAALRAHVAGLQGELAGLDHLDPVPLDGLHLTVQGVAFADQLDPAQVAALGARATAACADLRQFRLRIGPIGGYRAGTFLRASPSEPVALLRARLRQATGEVLGPGNVPDEPARFKPHVSVAYCHAAVPAHPTVARISRLRALPPLPVTVTDVSLLTLRREGHAYRWDLLHGVTLRPPRAAQPDGRLHPARPGPPETGAACLGPPDA